MGFLTISISSNYITSCSFIPVSTYSLELYHSFHAMCVEQLMSNLPDAPAEGRMDGSIVMNLYSDCG